MIRQSPVQINWSHFLLRRNFLLALRDNPSLVLFAIGLTVAVPLLSIRGAQNLAQFMPADSSVAAVRRIASYLGIIVYGQASWMVVGMIYIAKLHQRPLQYRYVPYGYINYLSSSMKRIIISTVLLSGIFFIPALFFMDEGLGKTYTLSTVIFFFALVVLFACLSAGAYLSILRIGMSREMGDGSRPQLLGTSSFLVAAALFVLVMPLLPRFLHMWTYALLGANWVKVLLCITVDIYVLIGLHWIIKTQPEHSLAHTSAIKSATFRLPTKRWIRIVTNRNLPFINMLRLCEAHFVYGCFVVAALLLAVVVRRGDATMAAFANGIVVTMLPYASVIYGLNSRNMLYGKEADSVRYVPLRKFWSSPFVVVIVVIWQVLLMIVLVMGASEVAGMGVTLPAIRDFVCVGLVMSVTATMLGTIFYKTTLANRLVAVALFFGCGFILQAVLQQMSDRAVWLMVASCLVAVFATAAVYKLEKSRRSAYEWPNARKQITMQVKGGTDSARIPNPQT